MRNNKFRILKKKKIFFLREIVKSFRKLVIKNTVKIFNVYEIYA